MGSSGVSGVSGVSGGWGAGGGEGAERGVFRADGARYTGAWGPYCWGGSGSGTTPALACASAAISVLPLK